jgi:hypothetical protein
MLSLWIGFGGPKPPPKMLPMSTESCTSRTQNYWLNMSSASGIEMMALNQNVTTELPSAASR